MTEKEQPLSPYSFQNSEYGLEDGTNYWAYLETLIRERFTLISTSIILTLISIVYAWMDNPIYQATIGFLEPQETYLSQLPPEIAKNLPGWTSKNRNGEIVQVNPSVFSRFLSKMESYSLKKEVFEKGGFKNKFYSDIDPVDLDHAVLELHNSISMIKEEVVKGPIKIKKDRLVYFNMEGANPEVMVEFLTVLAETTKQNIIVETNDQAKAGIKTKIRQISREIADLRLKAEKERESKIQVFSIALEIAKNLGIKDNSFSSLAFKVSSQTLVNGELKGKQRNNVENLHGLPPTWFLYGEKAINLEKKALESKTNDHIYNTGLFNKEVELNFFQELDQFIEAPKVYILSQPAISQIGTPRSDMLIVALGTISGLILGCLIALFKVSWQNRQKGNTTA